MVKKSHKPEKKPHEPEERPFTPTMEAKSMQAPGKIPPSFMPSPLFTFDKDTILEDDDVIEIED